MALDTVKGRESPRTVGGLIRWLLDEGCDFRLQVRGSKDDRWVTVNELLMAILCLEEIGALPESSH